MNKRFRVLEAVAGGLNVITGTLSVEVGGERKPAATEPGAPEAATVVHCAEPR